MPFLLNKDISLLWYELGPIHEIKILFYEESTFFMSQLDNFIPNYLSNVQFFMCAPKYLSIAQFLPISCLTLPAGIESNQNVRHVIFFTIDLKSHDFVEENFLSSQIYSRIH